MHVLLDTYFERTVLWFALWTRRRSCEHMCHHNIYLRQALTKIKALWRTLRQTLRWVSNKLLSTNLAKEVGANFYHANDVCCKVAATLRQTHLHNLNVCWKFQHTCCGNVLANFWQFSVNLLAMFWRTFANVLANFCPKQMNKS